MCAGKSIGVKGVADQDEDEWDFIIDVNLKGVMWCLKHQLRNISSGGSIGTWSRSTELDHVC